MTTKTHIQDLAAVKVSGTLNAWDSISRALMEQRPSRDDYYNRPRRVYRMYVPAFTYAGMRISAVFPDTKSLSRKNAELRVKFDELAAQWLRETEYLSSSTAIVAHPAYQEIIQMGTVALPWIIQALKETEGPWYRALRTITGENPVPPSEIGKPDAMTERWLEWWDKRAMFGAIEWFYAGA